MKVPHVHPIQAFFHMRLAAWILHTALLSYPRLSGRKEMMHISHCLFILFCVGLGGLATRRHGCFRRLDTLVQIPSGLKVSSDEIFVYRQTLTGLFKIQYDQASSFTSNLCVPEPVLAQLETELSKTEVSPRLEYDSDDEQTRNMVRSIPKEWNRKCYVMEVQPCCVDDLSGTSVDFSGIVGWSIEMIDVARRRRANGRLR